MSSVIVEFGKLREHIVRIIVFSCNIDVFGADIEIIGSGNEDLLVGDGCGCA